MHTNSTIINSAAASILLVALVLTNSAARFLLALVVCYVQSNTREISTEGSRAAQKVPPEQIVEKSQE